MAAPVPVAHTHVHSIRLAIGDEALVARVLDAGGTAGFGFTLNMEAAVARDMAAWDLHARNHSVPLCALLGTRRESVPLERDEEPALAPDWDALRRAMLERRYKLLRLDPFAWGSLEQVQTIAAAAAELKLPVALLAPNAHPWEIAWCATLAASVPGDGIRIILRVNPPSASVTVPRSSGIGAEWSVEPAFGAIKWLSPAPPANG